MDWVEEARQLIGGDYIFFGWQVSVETFVSIFRDAFPSPTYAKLMEIDQGRKGYQEYFGSLVEDGKLPRE